VSVASDSSLTRAAQSLEKEVQEVKATLQTMLEQLQEEEEEEGNELQDDDLMENGTEEEEEEEEVEEEEEEEEEEEDQYFSDSWGIWNECCVFCDHSQTDRLSESLTSALQKEWPHIHLLPSLTQLHNQPLVLLKVPEQSLRKSVVFYTYKTGKAGRI